jgi:hypothetical protein
MSRRWPARRLRSRRLDPNPPDHVSRRVAALKEHLGIADKRPETIALEDEALRLFRSKPERRAAGQPGRGVTMKPCQNGRGGSTPSNRMSDDTDTVGTAGTSPSAARLHGPIGSVTHSDETATRNVGSAQRLTIRLWASSGRGDAVRRLGFGYALVSPSVVRRCRTSQVV